jgi:hypothetical protein
MSDMKKKIVVTGPACTKESSKALADLLGGIYVPITETQDFRGADIVINYGSSVPFLYKRVINHPKAVKFCVNKISTLKRVVHGVEWTKDVNVALDWLKKDGAVVCRDKEEGNRSDGVMIAYTKAGFNECPAKFWTRYFDHVHEVRINVYKDKILSVYEKVTEGDYFDFQHMIVSGEHKQVDEMIASIRENIGIDLYGMDVLVNKKGVAKLLEINSGASLMEETIPELLPILKQEIASYV